MKIDFSEIKDWKEFEDLGEAFFRECSKKDDNQIIDIKVEQSGVGADGGRDILITTLVSDGIVTFKRKWVVQCKFWETLKKSDLDKINIGTLIREYNACGYLLIAKNIITIGVTQTFENLRKNCKDRYNYEIWNGAHFKHQLSFINDNLHKTFFPEYYNYSRLQDAKFQKIKENL